MSDDAKPLRHDDLVAFVNRDIDGFERQDVMLARAWYWQNIQHTDDDYHKDHFNDLYCKHCGLSQEQIVHEGIKVCPAKAEGKLDEAFPFITVTK